LHKPCVAIVGSRNASAIGQQFAQKIAGELGEAGITIVSGLARGIDRAAHYGSVASGTAAVLGGGVDHIYPRQNSEIYEQIRQDGALISESPLGYRATARDFPRRNRIISGLSLGVIVIEAAERSGTLITARYALEQNREVMAAPGSPLDPRTKGCNRLIQQGAALIESTEDIMNILEQVSSPTIMEPEDIYTQAAFDWDAAQDDIEKAHHILAELLSPTPVARDILIRHSNLPAPIAIAALLEMELSGQIFVEPDGRVSRIA
jgi:DNA processing protein